MSLRSWLSTRLRHPMCSSCEGEHTSKMMNFWYVAKKFCLARARAQQFNSWRVPLSPTNDSKGRHFPVSHIFLIMIPSAVCDTLNAAFCSGATGVIMCINARSRALSLLQPPHFDIGCGGETQTSVDIQFHPFITLKNRTTSTGTVARG
jgi:hypothetical protein